MVGCRRLPRGRTAATRHPGHACSKRRAASSATTPSTPVRCGRRKPSGSSSMRSDVSRRVHSPHPMHAFRCTTLRIAASSSRRSRSDVTGPPPGQPFGRGSRRAPTADVCPHRRRRPTGAQDPVSGRPAAARNRLRLSPVQRRRRHARPPLPDVRSVVARRSHGAMSEPSVGSEGLGRRAVRGAAVTTAGQGLRLAIQLASVVIMARLLSPADVGLFAMVMSIAGIAEVFRDFGLSQAAVQAPVLTKEQRDNLFWINCGHRRRARGRGVPVLVGHRGALRPGGARAARAARIGHVPAQRTGDAVPGEPEPGAAVHGARDDRRHRGRGRPRRGHRSSPSPGRDPWALVAQLLGTAFATLVLVVVFAGWLPGRPNRGAAVGGIHPVRVEHGRHADGDVRRQQRRLRRHRHPVRAHRSSASTTAPSSSS